MFFQRSLSKTEGMTFEVDRVKATLVADREGDDGEQTQALLNDVLDQAVGDGDGDEKSEMEDLLFVVKQYERCRAAKATLTTIWAENGTFFSQ